MAIPKSKIDTTCQNPKCKYYLRGQGKDIVKRGKNRALHQQYYCNHCHRWFVETTNTPLYRKQLPESEIINICKHLVERNGIRSLERITGHHRDTIGRSLEGMAEPNSHSPKARSSYSPMGMMTIPTFCQITMPTPVSTTARL